MSKDFPDLPPELVALTGVAIHGLLTNPANNGTAKLLADPILGVSFKPAEEVGVEAAKIAKAAFAELAKD